MRSIQHISRRRFAAQAAALGAALAWGSRSARAKVADPIERRDLYPQGVASGDPAPDSVILWTRREPGPEVRPLGLTVEVANDPKFRNVVARGSVRVGPETDWTCRFLAAGLRPAREYWYRFVDETGAASRVGRTLTAPADTDPRSVRFAFVSCQDVTQGATTAYRRMILEDERRAPEDRLGFVLHLGDFIYEVVWYPEDSPGGVKRGRRLRDVVRYPHGERMRDFHLPTDIGDYRAAYRSYLKDEALQDARARWPFVPVWDNHEFSWRGYQSQQFFDGPRPAQNIRLAASQAWYEYQPARVVKAGAGDAFEAPSVKNTPLSDFDARGVSREPNNLAAIRALRIERAFRYGAHAELIMTDNWSYRAPPADTAPFSPDAVPYMTDEEANAILDQGRLFNDGRPPATIGFGGVKVRNTQAEAPPQSYLGIEQMAWFKSRLRRSKAPWKIWGHSQGTLTWRTDLHNLPGPLRGQWPGAGYGVLNAGNFVEHAEIFDLVRDEGITGFAIVAGDKHSFWAGYPSKALPPARFEPVGVEFITGSISSPGLAEVAEHIVPKDHPLRGLYIQDAPNGVQNCALNFSVLHGVNAALTLSSTGNPSKARAQRNPEVAPHLRFADFAGHGYATVRVTAGELETEFVAIPRPLEAVRDGGAGTVLYRVRHRTPLWGPGEKPELRQEVVEGSAALSI